MAAKNASGYRWRVIAATSIGNALEWFDFVAYGFFAVIMAKLFFPASDDIASLLLTFATFGVPFLARPLGAIFMGGYADRHGRKQTLVLSIALMMTGTLAIALTPTYSTIGPWAAAIIVLARSIQGFSVGGEYGAATAFLVEQNPKQRGFLASWQYASQALTAVLATAFGIALNAMLAPADLEAWGWRIPFVFGLLIGPVGYYVRRHLTETKVFSKAARSRSPVRDVIANYWLQILLCVGVIVVSSVALYSTLFMPTFAIRQLGLSPSLAFVGSLLASALMMVLIPPVGWLSDRYSRTGLSLIGAVGVLVLAYPLFAWLAAVPTLTTLILVQAVLGVLNAITLGCLGGLIAGSFPTRVRTSGLSLANAIGPTLFGGTAPFINVWLIQATGTPLAPSFYLIFAAAISVAALLAMRRVG